MAGNAYRLLIEGELSTDKIQAKIDALNRKTRLTLSFAFSDTDLGKLQKKLNDIVAKGNTLGKIKLFENDKGGVNKAIVEYTNQMGQVERRVVSINKNLAYTKTRQIDNNKALAEYIKLQKDAQRLSAKQSDEMARATLNADKFLAKSQNLAKTSSVQATIGKAQEIKVAVSEGDINKVRKLNDQFAILKASLQTGRTGLDNWSQGMKNALKQTVEYALSVGLVYGALAQLKEGVQYVVELNKELTNIQLLQAEGAQTDEEIEILAQKYNNLAKEVGATTLEVAKGSVEWLRQGKSIEETGELLKQSMMFSKLGAMESSQATEYLTSIMNGFKLEASEVEDVISKLVALDNKFATSTAEIASAMQRSSVSAQQAGVSLDELASMITVVSDVSRRAPESIGESFKTMFARYQDILAGQVDEDGMGINNVGKALERVGINIRDAEGGFRDFSDVLDDLYPKWQELSEVEQANITKALAGVRQRESLLVLLENETKYRQALTETMNSEGLAAERYSIYMEGLEAAQNKAKASWEGLWQTSINSDFVKYFYDFGASVMDVITSMGGLQTILLIAIPALIAFKASTIAATITSFNLSVAIKAITVALTANPLTIWIALIALATAGAITWYNSLETATEKLTRLNKEISSSEEKIAGLRDNAKSIRELSDRFTELSEQEKLTTDESQELLDVQNKLKELVPTLSGHFDDYGNFLLDDSNKMGELTKATLEQIEAEKALRQISIDEQAEARASSLLQLQRQKGEADRGYRREGQSIHQIDEKEKIEINLDWANAVAESEAIFEEMSDDAKLAFIDKLRESGTEGGAQLAEKFTEEFSRISSEELMLLDDERGHEKIAEAGVTIAEELFESFSATLDGLVNDDDTIKNLIEKSMTEGLDFSDIQEIPEEYLDALSVEGDKLKLNINLIKEKQLAEAEMSLNSIRLAFERGDASAKEVEIIQLYYDQLLAQSQNTFGQFNQTAWAYDELLWRIANDAQAAGYSFVDMEGTALTSAQSIYAYLSSGDVAFNNFIQQAANATGRTVAETMNIVNGMITQTYNNTLAMIQNLGSSMAGIYAMQGYLASGGGGSPPAMPSLFPSPAPMSYSGGGGGSGGGGSTGETKAEKRRREREEREAERQRELESQLEEAQQDAVEGLQDQLDVYNDIIDARRRIIDSLVEERSYQQDIDEQNENILAVQNELAALQFDDSEEGNARRLELEDQLADAQLELENTQFEHSAEVQNQALDDEQAAFENRIENLIQQIEGIDATSLEDFASQLATILNQRSVSNGNGASGGHFIPTFHDGGGFELKSNELVAKLERGETVLTDRQTNNLIDAFSGQVPQSSSMNNGDITIEMPITVGGNLDRTVLPDLKRMVEAAVKQLNDNMQNRGVTRRADAFSI